MTNNLITKYYVRIKKFYDAVSGMTTRKDGDLQKICSMSQLNKFKDVTII